MRRLTVNKLASGSAPTCLTAIEHADTSLRRLRGLLGRAALGKNEGLLLSPCSHVHTFGMRFPLDVLFLNKDGTVVHCVPHLRPNRMAGAWRARHTLELAAGSIARLGLQTGDRLSWSYT